MLQADDYAGCDGRPVNTAGSMSPGYWQARQGSPPRSGRLPRLGVSMLPIIYPSTWIIADNNISN